MLCILKHVNHEVDGVVGGHHGVAVKYLRDVSEACRSVELGLVVTRLLAELHDGLDNVGFDAVILNLVRGLCVLQQFLVRLVVHVSWALPALLPART